ncbi:uncharacterized protein LOC126373400 [Pectinophora gossypiella]|uniref:Uncharacterized protein n=1 Tax=Pectinophora gossypiella TaxID=13191 RepID=A0A1E1W7S0_PECGO|nr:uncharacterized protein LOC126373400 [Pectinophora gossypiella]
MFARPVMRTNILRAVSRCYSEGTGQSQGSSSSSAPPPSSSTVPDVPGLSSAVVEPASQPVGPNVDPAKSGAYKVPEYYCYNNTSYFEAEIEMLKYRLPQPSALKN